MGDPLISVVTCTHNSEKYLKKALKSVETQSYKNIEHIFNDSYSTDKTLEIINDYIKRNGKKYKITFFQSKPKGVGNALNNALKKCTGDITHFLHSDDFYGDKHALARVANYFNQDAKLAWLIGNFYFQVKGKKYTIPVSKLIKINPKMVINTADFVPHENTFVKTKYYRKYGGFVESHKSAVEYRLWLRIIQDHEPLLVDDVFTVFIVHKGSTSFGNVPSLLNALIEAGHTQKMEKILPFIGPYENTELYKLFNEEVKL